MSFNEIGINPDYDYLFDPQQSTTYGYCERCGQDIYTKGDRLCYECQEADRAALIRRIRRGT